MVDGLDGLGHHRVVGGDDDDTDVGHLGAAGTHGRECFVARRVEEGDVASVGEFDAVRADVLRDASGLACDDVGLSDVVEQRRLAMVHMAHHRHDGRTRAEVFLAVLLLMDGIGHFCRHILGRVAEFFGHDVDGFGVEALVDAHHHTDVHARGYNLVDGHIHHDGKVVGGHKLGEL